ncbi:MAG: type II toxin-antitoxin system VapC family toxin [Terriglobales bacterium]
MSRTYVLDASAILVLLEDGPGAGRIIQLVKEARRSSTPLLMSILNWGEVFYQSWQRRGEESAKTTMVDLARLPIELVPVDQDLVRKAAEFKVVNKIPYVDCVAAALSALREATLVTSDRDFEKLERRVEILWIR